MIARRLATVVVAAAMIVGAFLIRRNVIEGDEGDADDDPVSPSRPTTELVCITELEVVCANLDMDVTVEDAGATLDRLAEQPAAEPAPLWLTVAPFPEMVDVLRENARLDPLFAEPQTLAGSQLAVATPAGRKSVLDAHCSEVPLWRCIGDTADMPWIDIGGESDWGVVKPSVGDAGESAAGLASFAAAVAGYFDDPDITRSVWEQEPLFVPWVQELVGSVPLNTLSGGTPILTMLRRPSAVNVAGASDAEIASLGAAIEGIESSYPEPSMWLQAVLAAPEGVEVPDALVTDASAALLAEVTGWDPPDEAAQPTLPSANTMLALRQLWEDIQ